MFTYQRRGVRTAPSRLGHLPACWRTELLRKQPVFSPSKPLWWKENEFVLVRRAVLREGWICPKGGKGERNISPALCSRETSRAAGCSAAPRVHACVRRSEPPPTAPSSVSCSRSPRGEKPQHPAAEPGGQRGHAELTLPRILRGSRPQLSHCVTRYRSFAVTRSSSACPGTGTVSAVTDVWAVPALHNPPRTAAGRRAWIHDSG